MRPKVVVAMLICLCMAGSLLGQIHLSGALSGTLGPNEYVVDSTIWVASGTTLTIQPGARFSFMGWFSFNIQGTLIAQGTQSDSIIFDCNTVVNPNQWQGLRFTGSSSASRLSYCRISKGKAQTYWPENSGGAIFCMNVSPVFDHCLFTQNSASMYGGAVYCYNAPATFQNCVFTSNVSSSQGGALYASLSALTLNECLILSNSAGSGTGGGIVGISSAMTITNTRVSYNTASTAGGISLGGTPSATLTNVLVDHNSSTGG